MNLLGPRKLASSFLGLYDQPNIPKQLFQKHLVIVGQNPLKGLQGGVLFKKYLRSLGFDPLPGLSQEQRLLKRPNEVHPEKIDNEIMDGRRPTFYIHQDAVGTPTKTNTKK